MNMIYLCCPLTAYFTLKYYASPTTPSLLKQLQVRMYTVQNGRILVMIHANDVLGCAGDYELKTGEKWFRLNASNFEQTSPCKLLTEVDVEMKLARERDSVRQLAYNVRLKQQEEFTLLTAASIRIEKERNELRVSLSGEQALTVGLRTELAAKTDELYTIKCALFESILVRKKDVEDAAHDAGKRWSWLTCGW